MKKLLVITVFLLLILPVFLIKAQNSEQDDLLRQQIGQMLIVGFRGTEINPSMSIYRDITQRNIGGVILFDYDVPSQSTPRNIVSVEQTKKLCRELQSLGRGRLFIALDQEGGKVSRLKTKYGFPPTVSAGFLGANDQVKKTSEWAQRTAQTLRQTGFNVNFAPSVDVNVNPDNPIIGALERSFSHNPEKVIKHASAWIKEHRKAGVLSSIKHFPGHGSSTKDSHKGAVDVSETWQDKELIPFQRLIADSLVDMVMTSHIFNRHFDADYPATLSYNFITKILRQRLGYMGVVVSDDLAMGAIAKNFKLKTVLEKTINAGVDMLILSNNGEKYNDQLPAEVIEIIFQLVKEGNIPESRIIESNVRIAKLKNKMLQYQQP